VTGFPHRGAIEGYYGPPYSHGDRLWLVERMGSWGLNRYVYAPKDDPLHRAEWRTRYGADALRAFAELVERGAMAGVQVGFAISPGLSMQYSSAADVAALREKLLAFRQLGARFLSLALDDVPSRLIHPTDRAAFGSLAEAHVSVAHAVREALGPEVTLWLVPTDYVGVDPTDYLETLGEALDPAIEVGWTGRTVVSPTIEAAEAARRAGTLRRRLLVWDNVPVADGPMRCMLHLGPYVGRDPELPRHVSGLILNTMEHAHASAVALRAASDYLRDPTQYDAGRSWSAAVLEIGAGAPAAFADFAAGHRYSATSPGDRDPELEAAVEAARGALRRDTGAAERLAVLRALLERRLAAPDALRAGLRDRDLLREIEPWLLAHREETERMLAALRVLDALVGGRPRFEQVAALFALESRLTRAPAPALASYGPRRVMYPQLSSLREDAAGFGGDPALHLDRCLTDALVRLAEEEALGRLGRAVR
jgi:hyaluronoglucosaminidase